jgi:hypothetical protein
MTDVKPPVTGTAEEVRVTDAPVKPLDEAVTVIVPGVEEARTDILLFPHSTGKLGARI